MKKLFFDITVAIRSPYLFTGLKVANFGIDSSAIRDENDPASGVLARAIIPGDHLRGHLRQNLRRLDSLGLIDQQLLGKLFGDESASRKDKTTEQEIDGNEPNRGALQFSDLFQVEEPLSETFTRTAIDDATGTVKDGALQVLELASPLNAVSTFKGQLVVFWDENNASDLEQALQNAFALTHAMGANKSSGFGEVVHDQSSISFDTSAPCYATSSPKCNDEKISFHMTFDRPILIDSERISDNVFRGRMTVPGGAIKGALAYALNTGGGMSSQLGTDLSKVIFSHGFLVDDNKLANRALPFSMVGNSDEDDNITIKDCLKNWQQCAPIINNKAADFQSDWKDTVLDEARLQTGRPKKFLTEIAHTKTAIDYATNTASDKQLFVNVSRATKGKTWRMSLNQNGASDDGFAVIVQTLRDSLHGIGRTQAVASFADAKVDGPSPYPLTIDGKKYWPIMLETAAIMSNPQDQTSISEQYENYFDNLKIGAKLICHFSDREMAGGYIPYRFRSFGDDVYQPFELTKPGSVFLIHGLDQTAITTLIKTGLPASIQDSTMPLDWKNCPYVAENGYGAISVDSNLHEQLALEGLS